MSIACQSPWTTALYMCYRDWRAPLFFQTWLIPIAPLHDRSSHFLVRICALIPSPISSHWHRIASWQNGGINSGMRGVILCPRLSLSLCLSGSLSPSLSICALFAMRGLYRSWNSSLPSDPISDLNILAVPPCKRRDEKSCPFTNALHPSISPYPLSSHRTLHTTHPLWHRPLAKFKLCKMRPSELHFLHARNHLSLIIFVFRLRPGLWNPLSDNRSGKNND